YPVSTPRPDWSEQDPWEWVRAAHAATRAAVARAQAAGIADPGARVAAIGFSGQMHGATLVDRANQPVRPCILWNDARSADECDRLEREIGAAQVLARTGNRLLPGFTAPKIAWVQRHEPEAWRATDCILLPKDFLRLHLGSRRATDAADASGTLYFDVAQRRWSEPMLHDLGIRTTQVPACHESPEVVDALSPAAAEAMGLRAGIPMVAGAGDQAAGAVGAGIVEPGRISAVLGTSGVLFAATDRFRASPDGALHAFCHAAPGHWHLMSVMLAAAGSLRWFRDTLAQEAVARAHAAQRDPYALLDEAAAAIEPGAQGLAFLPTLAGERCPYPDPRARGAFVGISQAHTHAHFARAVLEGVATSMAACLEMIRAAGVPAQEAVLGGGGFASPLWTQMHADAFGVPLLRTTAREGAAMGAALLAAVGGGAFESVAQATAQVRVTARVEPDPNARAAWQHRIARQRALHEALRAWRAAGTA
ncbi:MAG: xylulokinase, partial [Phycisphaerales bacterium]